MDTKKEKDEHIERLYHMKEDSKDSINDLKIAMNGNCDTGISAALQFDCHTLCVVVDKAGQR